MKNLLIITFAIFSLVACSEPEESLIYYDAHIYESLIEKLEKAGVTYRKGNNLNIFYSISQSEKVDQ